MQLCGHTDVGGASMFLDVAFLSRTLYVQCIGQVTWLLHVCLYKVTMETTISNYNKSLWQYVHPLDSVFEGIRSMVANRLATSGREWTELFSRFNSGTLVKYCYDYYYYNNCCCCWPLFYQPCLSEFFQFGPGSQKQSSGISGAMFCQPEPN